MKGIPERGNALETEPTLDDTSDYRFENLYRENRIEKRLDSQYPYLDLPFFRICDTFGGKRYPKPLARAGGGFCAFHVARAHRSRGRPAPVGRPQGGAEANETQNVHKSDKRDKTSTYT